MNQVEPRQQNLAQAQMPPEAFFARLAEIPEQYEDFDAAVSALEGLFKEHGLVQDGAPDFNRELNDERNDIIDILLNFGLTDFAKALAQKYPAIITHKLKTIDDVKIVAGKTNRPALINFINWDGFGQRQLVEPCDDNGNTPMHLLLGRFDIDEGIAFGLLKNLRQLKCAHKVAAVKNNQQRSALQILILSWLGDDPAAKAAALEQIDNYLPGYLTEAMTADIGGYNILHYTLQTHKNLAWSRMTGHPLFSALVNIARCDLMAVSSIRKVDLGNINENTFVLIVRDGRPTCLKMATRAVQNADDDDDNDANINATMRLVDIDVEPNSDLGKVLAKCDHYVRKNAIPAELKGEIRHEIIKADLIKDDVHARVARIFTTPNNENKTLVKIAIESSLPEGKVKPAEANNNPYQISTDSHLCTAHTENYHLLWWLFTQQALEQGQDGPKPFTEVLKIIFSNNDALEASIHLIDIDPTLFFKIMSFVRDELQADNPDNDKLAWLHRRFTELHGEKNTLPQMLTQKDTNSVHAFVIMHSINYAIEEIRKDVQAAVLDDDAELQVVLSDIHGAYNQLKTDFITDEDGNTPEYVSNLPGLMEAMKQMATAAQQKRASREEGDLTPTTLDYIDRGQQQLMIKFTSGELAYTFAFVPRFLDLIAPASCPEGSPDYDEVFGLNKTKFIAKNIFSNISQIHFLALLHEDILEFRPERYRSLLSAPEQDGQPKAVNPLVRTVLLNMVAAKASNEAAAKQYLAQHWGENNYLPPAQTKRFATAIAVQVMLTQSEEFMQILQQVFTISDAEGRVAVKTKEMQICAIGLLNAWLSIADDIYPKYKNKQYKKALPVNQPPANGDDNDDDDIVDEASAVVSVGGGAAGSNGGNLKKVARNRFSSLFKKKPTAEETAQAEAEARQKAAQAKAKARRAPTHQMVPFDVAIIPAAIIRQWPNCAIKPTSFYSHPHTNESINTPIPFFGVWACLANFVPVRDITFSEDQLPQVLGIVVTAMNQHMSSTRFNAAIAEKKLQFLIKQTMKPVANESSDDYVISALTQAMRTLIREPKLEEVGLRCVDVLAKLIKQYTPDGSLYNDANAEFARFVEGRTEIFKRLKLNDALEFAEATQAAKPKSNEQLLDDLIAALKLDFSPKTILSTPTHVFAFTTLVAILARNSDQLDNDAILNAFLTQMTGKRLKKIPAAVSETLQILVTRLTGPDGKHACNELQHALMAREGDNGRKHMQAALKRIGDAMRTIMGVDNKTDDNSLLPDLSGYSPSRFNEIMALSIKFAIIIEQIGSQNKKLQTLLEHFMLARNEFDDYIKELVKACDQFIKDHMSLDLTYLQSIDTNSESDRSSDEEEDDLDDDAERREKHTPVEKVVCQQLFAAMRKNPEFVAKVAKQDIIHEKMTPEEAFSNLLTKVHKTSLLGMGISDAPLNQTNNVLFYGLVLACLLLNTRQSPIEDDTEKSFQDLLAFLQRHHTRRPEKGKNSKMFIDPFATSFNTLLATLASDPAAIKPVVLPYTAEPKGLLKDKYHVAFVKKMKVFFSYIDIVDGADLNLLQLCDRPQETMLVVQVAMKLAMVEEAINDLDNLRKKLASKFSKFSATEQALMTIFKDAKRFPKDGEIPRDVLLLSINKYIDCLKADGKVIAEFVTDEADNNTITAQERAVKRVQSMLDQFVDRITDPKHPHAKWLAEQEHHIDEVNRERVVTLENGFGDL